MVQTGGVERVEVSPGDARVLLGNSLRLGVDVFDGQGSALTSEPITWATDGSVVTLQDTGGRSTVVQAVVSGQARVWATARERSDTVVIQVPEAAGEAGATAVAIETADGSVRLLFPDGAVGEQTPISVAEALAASLPAEPDSVDLMEAQAFEFGPSPLTFSEAVELGVRYDREALPTGVSEAQLRLYRAADGSWAEVAANLVDTDSQRVSGMIDGFSVYALGIAPNQPPSASFTVTCDHLECAFTDTSGDSEAELASWLWSFGDGSSSTEPNPTHTFAEDGTYSVSLTVTDVGGATALATQGVEVSARVTPTAAFDATCEALRCTFTDVSVDPDELIEGHFWEFGDGVTSNGSGPTHTYEEAGTYTVSLTILGASGALSSISGTVEVESAKPPSASFTFECDERSCAFVDGSTAGDGAIASWHWDFGDGSDASEQNPSHTYATAGTYSVTLTVTDDGGVSDTSTRDIEVNAPPSASFEIEKCDGLVCSFTDTSDDADGSIVSRVWEFGDGGTSTAKNVSHTYASAGNYTVSLTVVDNLDASHTFELDVTVAPVVPRAASFDVTCSDLECSFTDTSVGLVSEWEWDFGDGIRSTAPNPRHEYAVGGEYSVTLIVTYGDGFTASASQSLVVSVEVSNGEVRSGLSAGLGETLVFEIELPSGVEAFWVTLSGGSGDADLYLARGRVPTPVDYDCWSFAPENTDTCVASEPDAGRWYISLVGAVQAFDGVEMEVAFVLPTSSSFDIDIAFDTGLGLSASQVASIVDGISRWSEVISEDVPGFFASGGTCGGRPVDEYVDDIKVFVSVAQIPDSDDGPLGADILAQAAPCWQRPTSSGYPHPLPVVGQITIDVDDLDILTDRGTLAQVMNHEMAHVLGFGTIWDSGPYDLIGGTDAEPFHTGTATTLKYMEAGGVGQAPIQPYLRGHWDEGVFGDELMTPVSQPEWILSAVSAAAMEDLGYVVDYGAVDAYVLPGTRIAAPLAPPLERGFDLSGDTDWMRDKVLLPDGRLVPRAVANEWRSRGRSR